MVKWERMAEGVWGRNAHFVESEKWRERWGQKTGKRVLLEEREERDRGREEERSRERKGGMGEGREKEERK